MKKILKKINNENFIFDHSGAIFFKSLETLIFSDLHLGKSLSFLNEGNLIPPYDLDETLIRLEKIIKKYKPKKLISLGDSFHENKSIKYISESHINLLNNLLQNIEVTWIEGNHDSNLLLKENILGDFKNYHKLKSFKFIHSKSKISSKKTFEFSGHFHPKISIKFNGLKYSYKCFILTDNFCILPSFGTFTGGLDIKSKEFVKILPLKKKNFYYRK